MTCSHTSTAPIYTYFPCNSHRAQNQHVHELLQDSQRWICQALAKRFEPWWVGDVPPMVWQRDENDLGKGRPKAPVPVRTFCSNVEAFSDRFELPMTSESMQAGFIGSEVRNSRHRGSASQPCVTDEVLATSLKAGSNSADEEHNNSIAIECLIHTIDLFFMSFDVARIWRICPGLASKSIGRGACA